MGARGYIIDIMPVPMIIVKGMLVWQRVGRRVAWCPIITRLADRLRITRQVVANHIYDYGVTDLIADDEEQYMLPDSIGVESHLVDWIEVVVVVFRRPAVRIGLVQITVSFRR